jgi:hypothetical protein
MNEIVQPVSFAAAPRSTSPLSQEVIVGKDIIELLTGAMYADPLTIYREYVQNAADAIQEARRQDLEFGQGPHVSIHLDHAERVVRIRDGGVGLSAEDFERRLTAFGASYKRGAALRGFRGVGRLSGLGYCQELIFRSRQHAKAKVLELRWDNRLLRERLRDANFKGTLGELVKEVASVSTLSGAEYPARFFEVELRKVIRIKNDLLMNEDEIRGYLSEVAPVPFASDFTFAPRIRKWLTEHGVAEPIDIELNDGKGAIRHRARNEVVSKAGVTTFHNVDCIPVRNSAGELLAIGWVLEHDYIGSLPAVSRLSGIRLRVGDIQVGSELILAGLFTESRFASWASGEFHVLHPRIVPNGRRDDFEHSAAHGELLDGLQVHAKNLSAIIRSKSDDRRRQRRARLAVAYARSWIELARDKKSHATIRLVASEQAQAHIASVEKECARVEVEKDTLSELAQLKKSVARIQDGFETKPGRPPTGQSKGAVAAVRAILSSTTQMAKAVPLAERVLEAMEATVETAKAKPQRGRSAKTR